MGDIYVIRLSWDKSLEAFVWGAVQHHFQGPGGMSKQAVRYMDCAVPCENTGLSLNTVQPI